jgi:L-iditol 2-dehydrogenase
MRGAELIDHRIFQLCEDKPHDPAPGEVQVRMEAVGICGSDLHAYSEGGVGGTPCVYPMVIGHEPSGVIVKTGSGVSGWQAGDRVFCEPAIYCYHCEYCRTGQYNVCANVRFMSMPPDPGFFRDVVNLPARNLLGVPADLGLRFSTWSNRWRWRCIPRSSSLIAAGETAAVRRRADRISYGSVPQTGGRGPRLVNRSGGLPAWLIRWRARMPPSIRPRWTPSPRFCAIPAAAAST